MFSRVKLRNVLLYIIISMLLVGCTEQEKVHPPKKNDGASAEEVQKIKLPLAIENGDFNSVIGWLDNARIIYQTDTNDAHTLYTYDLYSGKSKELYVDEHPIISVQISPSKDKLIVHSSPNSNEAILTVLTIEGDVLVSKTIPSSELNLVWNHFQEDMILVSTFSEDWRFTTYGLNINNGKMTEINLPQPFGKWIDANHILYLDWDIDTPMLTAQLKKFNMETEESSRVLTDMYGIDTLGDTILTIEPNASHPDEAIYRFFSSSFKEIFSFKTPHLTRYSGWVVPYYSFNAENKEFLILQPLHSSEADIYDDGFTLVAYDIKSGAKEVLLQGLDNEPISCSPNGELCLSGFYFEKMIKMDDKEVIKMIEENSNH